MFDKNKFDKMINLTLQPYKGSFISIYITFFGQKVKCEGDMFLMTLKLY